MSEQEREQEHLRYYRILSTRIDKVEQQLPLFALALDENGATMTRLAEEHQEERAAHHCLMRSHSRGRWFTFAICLVASFAGAAAGPAVASLITGG
jgi:hypothetical protein